MWDIFKNKTLFLTLFNSTIFVNVQNTIHRSEYFYVVIRYSVPIQYSGHLAGDMFSRMIHESRKSKAIRVEAIHSFGSTMLTMNMMMTSPF